MTKLRKQRILAVTGVHVQRVVGARLANPTYEGGGWREGLLRFVVFA